MIPANNLTAECFFFLFLNVMLIGTFRKSKTFQFLDIARTFTCSFIDVPTTWLNHVVVEL